MKNVPDTFLAARFGARLCILSFLQEISIPSPHAPFESEEIQDYKNDGDQIFQYADMIYFEWWETNFGARFIVEEFATNNQVGGYHAVSLRPPFKMILAI